MPEPAKTSKCPNDKDFYADVNYCQGSISLAGMRNHFYFIPRRYIVKWPTVKKEPVALKDLAVLEGDFVLQSDKKFIRVDLVPNKSKLTAEQIGQFGGKHFKNAIELPLPGTEEEATALINSLCNEDAVFLVPERNGKYRLVGNESFQVDIKTSQDTGEAGDDQNSTNIALECEDYMAAPFYPGKIVTSDGDISGADGQLIVPGGVPGA